MNQTQRTPVRRTNMDNIMKEGKLTHRGHHSVLTQSQKCEALLSVKQFEHVNKPHPGQSYMCGWMSTSHRFF